MRKHRKGLSVPQFRTLVWIDRHPAATLSAVAEHLGATLPTTSRIVDGLVSRGFLSRKERTDDRRQVALAITAAGRAVLDPAWSATRHEVELRLAALSADEQATISRAMQLLVATLGGEGGGTPSDTTKD
jgi:DNA-binding MarR family transcriptional regulator